MKRPVRYRKQWYVIHIDEHGDTISSDGPYTWPRAQRLRDERRKTDINWILRRTRGGG